MNLKLLVRLAVFLATIVAANSSYAGPLYAIDPSQSYVSAYVPNWTAYSYTPPSWIGPDAPPPPTPEVLWNLAWDLERFQLAGNFQGAIEQSPWVPNVAHLTITDANLISQVPAYVQGPTLPGQLTYSVSNGGVFSLLETCGLGIDPFYPPPPFDAGSCIHLGGTGYANGTYLGETLTLAGGSGALQPVGIVTPVWSDAQPIADPGPPPPLDPSQYPTQWVSYQIVAQSVPEPGTLVLVAMAGAVLLWVRRRGNNPPYQPA